MTELYVWIIVLCAFAAISGAMAGARNRSVGGWGVAGFFFGFLIIIILAAVGPANDGPSVAGPSPLDEIKKLKALKDSGVLSEDEFNQQKRNLLAQAA
ncbi:MAG: SHOCT domain-containing protein [Proteobacteria bacterium]|nr:SHOCT domain-containing protein [Pseudomonadota bacterium]